MREFTNTSNSEKFQSLRRALESRPGTIRVFDRVQLPSNCTPNVVRIGFKAVRNGHGGYSYTVYIDKNVRYTGTNLLFKLWLQDGDWQFPSYEKMTMFFHSQLKNL